MPSNVHVLPVPSRRRHNPSPDPLVALAGLSSRIARVGQMPIATKEEMQQAIALLDLSNVQARRLIGRIDDDESRARLIAHSELIGELVAIARQKVAAL